MHLVPLQQGLSPLISGLAGSPFRAPLKSAEAQLRDLSPPVLRGGAVQVAIQLTP
jgi:hypothetical protein